MRLLFIALSPFSLRLGEILIKSILVAHPFKFFLKRTSYYQITYINISKCFPENSKAENEILAYKSFIETIFSLYETLYSWSRSELKVSSAMMKQENRFLLRDPSPKLIYSMHNKSIDLLLSFIMLQNQVTTLYKTIKSKALNNYVIKQRSKNNSSVATASIAGVKAVIKSLKTGKDVCFAADQVPADGLGVNSYIFNSICYSSNLVESISSKEGVKTCFVYLTKNEYGYITSYKHLSSHPVSTDSMNKIFEESILIRPEEYSWEYKKFRKIPENKNLYKL